MVKFQFVLAAVAALSAAPSLTSAKSAQYSDMDVGHVQPMNVYTDTNSGDSLPRWIGPLKQMPTDGACYRETHRVDTCPPGFNSDNIATCWAQCPLEYPVECGMECLPQNADCAKEVLSKVTKTATVALNAATTGVFGSLVSTSAGLQTGVKCAQGLLDATKKVMGYVEELENGGQVGSTADEVMFALSKTDFLTVDMPIAVATCMGLPAPKGLEQVNEVVTKVEAILKKLLAARAEGKSILDPSTFIGLVRELGVDSVDSMQDTDVDQFATLMTAGATCGNTIKAVVDRVIAMVNEIKTNSPDTPVAELRLTIMSSDLLLQDLPNAAASCFNVDMPDAFAQRDQVLKAAHVIIDEAISLASDGDTPRSKADYAIKIVESGLDAVAVFDPTGLANLAKEFIQPICGPSAFIGDIDDGSAADALGMLAVQKAFMDSEGSWSSQGDGQVSVVFTSVDDKDVSVNVLSGGQVYQHVDVKAGETVNWSAPLSDLQGKTLYLDRWRPGFFGIAGTGGGSVVLWVPNSTSGQLSLEVKLNPTSFKDHRLRH